MPGKSAEFDIGFIGVGFAKCGTTWLHDMLNQHPEICMSRAKEVSFFCNKLGIFDDDRDIFQKGFGHYKKFFENHDLVCGDISVNYITDPLAIQRIQNLKKPPKIIVNYRNPIDAAYSHWRWYAHGIGIEKLSFEEALIQRSDYLDRHRYFKHSKPLFEAFERDKIFVVDFDEISNQPADLLAKLTEFLEVSDHEFDAIRNPSNQAFESRFNLQPLFDLSQSFINSKYSGIYVFLLKAGVYNFLRTAITLLNTKKLRSTTQLSKDTRRYIWNQIDDDAKALSELTGHNFYNKWMES